MLRAAIDLCKVGGYVVYSTCSFAIEENEEVVDYAVKCRYVKIIDTGLGIEGRAITKWGEKRFCDRIKYCVRVYPHVNNLDGFFFFFLKKTRNGERSDENDKEIAK